MGQHNDNTAAQGVVLAVLVVVLLLTLALFFLANRLEVLLGATGTQIITRLLGIVLAALAVQYVLDGLRNAFG